MVSVLRNEVISGTSSKMNQEPALNHDAIEAKSPLTLLSDVAIADVRQDCLERAPFARSLARSILDLESRDSFVFGLCGPWGSGKTSVLNLVLAELKSIGGDDAPIVVHFNPWWFSGKHQLLESFLSQFAAALQMPKKGRNAEKASGMLQKLATGLRPLSLIPFVGEFAKAGSEAAGNAAEFAKSMAEAAKQDVHRLRQAIDEALTEFDRKILIVMDDIDRLAADEIAEIFLILKAVADFPNTIYFLSFDHDVVCSAIKENLGVNGRTYLEKIVQLQIDVPTIGYMAIHNLFIGQLGALIGNDHLTKDDQHDLGNFFHDGVKQFLTTPRSAKKLLNILRFMYPPLRGEVYLADMLAIATLFTFVPSAIAAVSSNSGAFIGTARFGDNRDSLKAFHEGWLNELDAKVRANVDGLLKRLFPKYAWAFGGSTFHSDFELTWRRQLRIRSEAHFDKYFMFSVPQGAISEAEWQSILGEMANSDTLGKRIEILFKDRGRGDVTKCKEFLERAADWAEKLSAETNRVLFATLIKYGDFLIAVKDEVNTGGFIPTDNWARVQRAMMNALLYSGQIGDRQKLWNDCLTGSSGLHIACEFLNFLAGEHGLLGQQPSDSQRAQPLLLKADVESSIKKICRRIATESRRTDSLLQTHPAFLRIAHDWYRFGAQAAATRWLRRVAKDDQTMLAILDQASSTVRSQGGSDRVLRQSIRVDTTFLEMFLSLPNLKRHAQRVLASSAATLSPSQTLLLRLTIDGISDDGKPCDQMDRRRMAEQLDDT